MIGAGGFEDIWGFVADPNGDDHQDLLVPIITRAVKLGFHVVLLQPGTEIPACTATDAAIKRGHVCDPYDLIVPQESAAKVRPAVTSAVGRARVRYGWNLNVAIDVSASGYSQTDQTDMPPTLDGPRRVWLTPDSCGRGGLVAVPPSIVRGVPVRCWGVS